MLTENLGFSEAAFQVENIVENNPEKYKLPWKSVQQILIRLPGLNNTHKSIYCTMFQQLPAFF